VKSLSPEPEQKHIVLDAAPTGVRVVDTTRSAFLARRARDAGESAFARGRAE
jgi:hypothetical protein